MGFQEALLHPAVPLTLFEVVPPAAGKPEALDSSVDELRQLRGRVDAINIPEIHDEDRPGERIPLPVFRGRLWHSSAGSDGP